MENNKDITDLSSSEIYLRTRRLFWNKRRGHVFEFLIMLFGLTNGTRYVCTTGFAACAWQIFDALGERLDVLCRTKP